jgi:hypothetical protein
MQPECRFIQRVYSEGREDRIAQRDYSDEERG